MQPQKTIPEKEETSVLKKEESPPHLSSIFDGMSNVSDAVNYIASSSSSSHFKEENTSTRQPTSLFENLQKLADMPVNTETRLKRKRPNLGNFTHDVRTYPDISPPTPTNSHIRCWAQFSIAQQLPCAVPSFPTSLFPLPIMNDEPMTDDELVKMKGPSRLIGFLVHLAMNERARKALRWTGNGLEFVLVNKELVAKMWGNRKHNTKDMDYYKLSRAIREKYEKKDKADKNIKPGKLKKGTRTYSYVFTEHAYPDLMNQTEKDINFITRFAADIGQKYSDNSDLNNVNSPKSPSPQNSD